MFDEVLFGPFNGTGHLGFPRLGIREIELPNWFDTRVLRFYLEILQVRKEANESDLKKLLNSLLPDFRGDARIVKLKDALISNGSGMTRFELFQLEVWFLWCANEFGLEVAKESLDRWLDADEIEVMNALWVYGIELEAEIPLEDGYCITPARNLPNSSHKEQALMHTSPLSGPTHPAPSAAITKLCVVSKTGMSHLTQECYRDDNFRSVVTCLFDIALVLNTVQGVSCVPAFNSGYLSPKTPFGPFGGRGCGGFLYDVVARKQATINGQNSVAIIEAADNFKRLNETDQNRFRRILSRMSQAKRRLEIEDKVLDLCIVLEMLLLKDKPRQKGIRHNFCSRGAYLVSPTTEEREKNEKLLNDLYTYRCDVAHTGLLCGGDQAKSQDVQKRYPEFEELAEKICRRLLQNPKVKWDELLLGGVEHAT